MNALEWIEDNLPSNGERRDNYYRKFLAAYPKSLFSKEDVSSYLRDFGFYVMKASNEKHWRYKLLPNA